MNLINYFNGKCPCGNVLLNVSDQKFTCGNGYHYFVIKEHTTKDPLYLIYDAIIPQKYNIDYGLIKNNVLRIEAKSIGVFPLENMLKYFSVPPDKLIETFNRFVILQ
jgi:hypothetical protein